jgi:hypothetical protein
VVNTDPSQCWVAIDHGNGEISFYLHVANIEVFPGTPVTSSTAIGNPSRLCFNATGIHVHLAFATYTASSPARVGEWDPDSATWARSFPTLDDR